jgi:hypothetical protein
MAPGNLVVVEPDRVGTIPTEPDGLPLELESLPLVGPLNDEQRGHDPVPVPAGQMPHLAVVANASD